MAASEIAQLRRKLYMNIGYLGVCFSLLFTAFNVVQSFVTTLYPALGFYILLTVYGAYGVSSVVSPRINAFTARFVSPGTSERLLMTLAAASHVVFIVGAASGNSVLVLLTAAVNGAGAGVLWVCQGVYLTKMVDSYESNLTRLEQEATPVRVLGTATGQFFALFNLNSIIGNVVALIILYSGGSLKFMVWFMSGVAIFATLMMSVSSAIPKGSSNSGTPSAKEDVKSSLGLWSVLSNRKLLLLTPYMVCQGINVSFNYGNFPTYVAFVIKRALHDTSAEIMTPESIQTRVSIDVAWVFMTYGVGALLGSGFWGKVYDRFHRRLLPLLSSHVVLTTINFALVVVAVVLPMEYAALTLLRLCAFIFGTIDFLTNAVINNSISNFLSGEEAGWGFCWYRVCFCIGFVVHAALSGVLPGVESSAIVTAESPFQQYGWLLLVILNIGAMLASVGCGFVLDRGSSSKVAAKADIVTIC